MRINVAIPEAQVKEPILNAALEAVTRLNEELIKDGTSPTAKQLIAEGAKWKPEPPGAEHFDHGGIIAERGWGDCDDWAPLHAASLRVTGVDKGATAVVMRSGPGRWHAIVKRSNGQIEDPSEAAGMGSGNGYGISGAVLPIMSPAAVVGGAYIVRPQLALRPVDHGWQARLDIPWHWRDKLAAPPTANEIAMTALHQHPVANPAICGALEGGLQLAEAAGFADPEHLDRIACMADYCHGVPLHELVQEYGHEHARAAHQVIGSFWSAIKKAAGTVTKAVTSPVTSAARFVTHPSLSNLTRMVTDPVQAHLNVAKPLANVVKPFTPLMRFVPGVGPLAATAVNLASQGLPTNLSDAARFFAQNAPGFVPGVGPALQMAQQFMPQGGGAPPPQPPPPPQYRPQQYSFPYQQPYAQPQPQPFFPQAWPGMQVFR